MVNPSGPNGSSASNHGHHKIPGPPAQPSAGDDWNFYEEVVRRYDLDPTADMSLIIEQVGKEEDERERAKQRTTPRTYDSRITTKVYSSILRSLQNPFDLYVECAEDVIDGRKVKEYTREEFEGLVRLVRPPDDVMDIIGEESGSNEVYYRDEKKLVKMFNDILNTEIKFAFTENPELLAQPGKVRRFIMTRLLSGKCDGVDPTGVIRQHLTKLKKYPTLKSYPEMNIILRTMKTFHAWYDYHEKEMGLCVKVTEASSSSNAGPSVSDDRQAENETEELIEQVKTLTFPQDGPEEDEDDEDYEYEEEDEEEEEKESEQDTESNAKQLVGIVEAEDDTSKLNARQDVIKPCQADEVDTEQVTEPNTEEISQPTSGNVILSEDNTLAKNKTVKLSTALETEHEDNNDTTAEDTVEAKLVKKGNVTKHETKKKTNAKTISPLSDAINKHLKLNTEEPATKQKSD